MRAATCFCGARDRLPAMADERVRIEVADHVADVALVRADKHNALDRAMFEAIVDAASRVAAEPSARVAVLHGEGPSFCSGIDLASLLSGGSGIDGVLAELAGGSPNY